jgi:UDP-N-acetylglucosamine 2-epimerase (non-hydrolysing)
MIDTLFSFVEKAQNRAILEELSLLPGGYGVVTLHRPSNVDDPKQLRELIAVMIEVSKQLPLVFAVHPRTARALEEAQLKRPTDGSQITMLGPQGYLDFLALTSQAKLVMTDSGGLQEETTALGIPCLTLRENTERPITLTEGTSTLVGNDFDQLRAGIEAVLDGDYPNGRCPELWDGRAGQRIARILADSLGVAISESVYSFQRAA